MSKSLTINAPQIVQTRNTLNAVPSGSTAEPDYSVKFVPQDLTEEQQAQARQNIGAAAAGETGGATVNEFHYKRGGEEGSYYYYIDCQGYTPAEGDLMVVVFDWPMYPEHNPITLMNGSDNPSFVLLNAPASEYNYYDDIEGTVNTRWMVKLEKVNNVWTAYNVNTIELADWNVTDPTAIGYIKNKPEISDTFNADDVFTFYWDNMSEGTVAAILRTDGVNPTKVDYIYENGVKAVYNSTATQGSDLAVGEWGEWGAQTYYKFRAPINKLNVLKIRFSDKRWQTFNITSGKCIGMVIPNEPANWNMEWSSHYYDRMSTSYLNYTVIFPKWITSIATGSAPDTTKQVVLCPNPTQVNLVGSNVTELILTNTSVPASVYTAVQSSTITKVWLPRATYDLAVVDANWSAYASKLFPYDFLSFGPDNYVIPVALS